MHSNPSEERLIKNEQLLRTKNTVAERSIKKYFQGDKTLINAPIAFVCECSRLDCNEHINISIDRYERLHKRRDRFTVFRGHHTPSVEKIVSHDEGFDVVQKSALKA